MNEIEKELYVDSVNITLLVLREKKC